MQQEAETLHGVDIINCIKNQVKKQHIFLQIHVHVHVLYHDDILKK
jgi:hypothetical protein